MKRAASGRDVAGPSSPRARLPRRRWGMTHGDRATSALTIARPCISSRQTTTRLLARGCGDLSCRRADVRCGTTRALRKQRQDDPSQWRGSELPAHFTEAQLSRQAHRDTGIGGHGEPMVDSSHFPHSASLHRGDDSPLLSLRTPGLTPIHRSGVRVPEPRYSR
jgi:hypothetical protein